MTNAPSQLVLFAIMFACGWCVALALNIVSLATHTSKSWVRRVAEIPASILALVFVWWCNLKYCAGQFRIALVCGIFIGGLAYYTICKEILDKIVRLVYNFFIKKR